MSNTAWQSGRREAGKEDRHRHTVGKRLREVNARENTISDLALARALDDHAPLFGGAD
jgi:hypothetical protein